MNYFDLAFKEQTLFELLQVPSKTELEATLKIALQNILNEIEDSTNRKRLNQLFALIASEINPMYKTLLAELPKDAVAASVITYGSILDVSLPKVTVEEILNQNRLVQGYQFKDLIKATGDNHVRQLKRVIGAGVAQGKAAHEIIEDVRLKNTSLLEHQLNTVVHTYISESRAIARHRAYNDIGFDCFEYVATLDSRTSEYCRNHDGRKYHKSINLIQSEINRHMNCRSVFVPCFDGKEDRASQFGAVDGNITYGEWFRLQDEKFQRTVLGKKKLEAYKNGKYKIGGLHDVRGAKLSFIKIENML